VVSALCFLTLIGYRPNRMTDEVADGGKERPTGWQSWALRAGVVIALTAGLLTQYLFAYWLFALAAIALYLDRKHWFQHGLTMGAGVLMFIPWALWGVRQQIKNRGDVLNQISSEGGPLDAMLAHGKDLAQTVGNHLLLGHWTTGMLPIAEPIKPTAVAIGCGVIGFLIICIVGLYRRRQYRTLMVAGLMGLVPLAVALTIDILADKYTVGFGWGRSTMVALPGCVLLVAAWLELGTGRWRTVMTAGLLAVYLGVTVGDFAVRDRQIFSEIGNGYIPETSDPVLVVMNTRAWGHVLRLVYYVERMYPKGAGFDVDLLATDPADVADALSPALEEKDYRTVLWMKADYPLWSAPDTREELESLNAEAESILQAQFGEVRKVRSLQGTMKLDYFELQSYMDN
ncbi:MAG: hypothetical protein AAFU53_16810, partial [Cyanobacteria bacterium J06632_3]